MTLDLVTKEILNSIGIIGVTNRDTLRTANGKRMAVSDVAQALVDKDIFIKSSEYGELFEVIKKAFTQSKPSISFSEEFEESDKQFSVYLSKITPVMDYEVGGVQFYDQNLREIVLLAPEAYLAKNLLGVETMADLRRTAIAGIFRFNPHVHAPTYVETMKSGQATQIFNLCRVPVWKTKQPTDASKMPESIEVLFNSVFGDQSGRDYALEWIYYSVFERNQTFLSLIGSQGVGKDLLATVIGHGVGGQFQKVDNSILLEKFNSQMRNARVIFYDEVTAKTESALNRLKQFTNNRIAFESKGQDAETIENFTSGIIANNALDAIAVSPEDRRFSMPKIGDVPLFRVYMNHYNVGDQEAREMISKFAQDIDSFENPSEDIVNFYHWLENRFKNAASRKYSPATPYKGEYFYYICEASLPLWFQDILDYCRDFYYMKKIPLSDIRKSIPAEDQKKFPRATRIKKKLETYRHIDEVKIGSLTGTEQRSSFIELTEEFIMQMERLNGETIAERRKKENYFDEESDSDYGYDFDVEDGVDLL